MGREVVPAVPPNLARVRHLEADNGAGPFPILNREVPAAVPVHAVRGFSQAAGRGACTTYPRSLRRPALLLDLTLALWVVQWAV